MGAPPFSRNAFAPSFLRDPGHLARKRYFLPLFSCYDPGRL
jgi:hypothetical protein